jgi:serine/threonine protein phosphatase PrpC
MEDNYVIGSQRNIILLGIFDGHGGDLVSNLASEHFCDLFYTYLDERGIVDDPRVIGDALQMSCGMIDDMIVNSLDDSDKFFSNQNYVPASEYKGLTGSTACLAVLMPGYIVTANLGDSRCILIRNGDPKALNYRSCS